MNQQGKLALASIISLVGVIVLLSISVFLLIEVRGIKSAKSIDISRQQNLASELLDNKLYLQAIAEYDKIIQSGKIDTKKQANLNYITGNIYMDNLSDYQEAAARFVKAKVLGPDDELVKKINKNLVTCFERMGRSLDAQRELDKMTLLEKPEEEKGTRKVVARIGKREFTMADLENEIQKLRSSVAPEYKDKEKKLEFLKQWVAHELFYDAALRKGYDQDKDVIQGTFQMKKQLMINKLLEEEVPSDVQISDSEIKLYYDAHKDDFKERRMEEVRTQIESELIRQRQEEAYMKLLSRMMQAEQVKIYEDQF
jgi:tetratricopeptide (TPR) repeat protein